MNAEYRLEPPTDPFESLREQADEFADAEMERMFPDADAMSLLDACCPHWYTTARDRISDVKFSALRDAQDEAAAEQQNDAREFARAYL
jgi:hypothetical protein